MTAPVAPGDIIAGKYRVERVLGQGGMGIVVAATHLQLGQLVAIKLLLQEVATPESVERFLREARALVRLKSEHAARVIDVGEASPGMPYMVMEHLEGSDLADVIASRGRLPVQDAVDHLLHACEAIAEAHAAGIIHRDLKPGNLFLTKAADGSASIKVLDFGISKSAEPDGAPKGKALTATTTVFGSPAYMSPEQMRSARDADARSDLWSLGVILYELLSGTIPFDGPTYPDLVLAVNMSTPESLTKLRPEIPAPLEAAVFRCFERNRDARFPSVAEFALAIAPFGSTEAQTSARRIARTAGLSAVTPPAAVKAPDRELSDTGERPPAPRSTVASITTEAPDVAAQSSGRAGWMVFVGGLLGGLGVVGVTLVLLHGRGRAVDPPEPALGAEHPESEPRRPAPPPSASAASGPEVAVSTALPPSPPPEPSSTAAAPRTGGPVHLVIAPAIPTTALPAIPSAAPIVAPPVKTAAPAASKKSPFDVTIK